MLDAENGFVNPQRSFVERRGIPRILHLSENEREIVQCGGEIRLFRASCVLIGGNRAAQQRDGSLEIVSVIVKHAEIR